MRYSKALLDVIVEQLETEPTRDGHFHSMSEHCHDESGNSMTSHWNKCELMTKWDYEGIFETPCLFMWHFKYTKSNKHQGNAIKVKGDRVEKMFVHLGKKSFNYDCIVFSGMSVPYFIPLFS